MDDGRSGRLDGLGKLVGIAPAGLGHRVASAASPACDLRRDLDHVAGLHAALRERRRDRCHEMHAAVDGGAEHDRGAVAELALHAVGDVHERLGVGGVDDLGQHAGAVDLRGARGEGGRIRPLDDGAVVLAEVVDAPDAKALMDIADRVKGKLGDAAAIVLGTVVDGRVHLVAAVTPALVERGVKAGEVVKVAAQIAGGGGGGRDTMAQAGGRDPDKLPEAIEAAREAIVHALG